MDTRRNQRTTTCGERVVESLLTPLYVWKREPLLQEFTTSSKPSSSSPSTLPPLRKTKSILRSKTTSRYNNNNTVSSEDYGNRSRTRPRSCSLPSLMSLKDDEDDGLSDTTDDTTSNNNNNNKTMITTTTTSRKRNNRVSFQRSLSVRKFERSKDEYERTWYTPYDLENFKLHALSLIEKSSTTTTTTNKRHSTGDVHDILPTGTNRCFIKKQQQKQQQQRTSFTSPRPMKKKPIVFTHKALGLLFVDDDDNDDGDGDDHDDDDEENHPINNTSKGQERRGSRWNDLVYRKSILEYEIRNILLIDPHDICLRLFTKALKVLFPHVQVTTARTSEEAYYHMTAMKNQKNNNGLLFDIILVEERLKLFHNNLSITPSPSVPTMTSNNNTTNEQQQQQQKIHHSGSAFIAALSRTTTTTTTTTTVTCNNDLSTTNDDDDDDDDDDGNNNNKLRPLFIGVSAHIHKDKDRLEKSGADFCWSKPPPLMNETLRNTLLKRLLLKRGKIDCANDLFGSSYTS